MYMSNVVLKHKKKQKPYIMTSAFYINFDLIFYSIINCWVDKPFSVLIFTK